MGWKKLHSFGFAKRLLLCRAKPNVCNAGRQKEILKNAKGWLFLSFLSPVSIAKYGQLESLSAWSIWSVCRVHYYSLSCCVVCLFSIGGNGLGIAEGGDFYHKSSIEERMFNFVQMLHRSTSTPLLAIPCACCTTQIYK